MVIDLPETRTCNHIFTKTLGLDRPSSYFKRRAFANLSRTSVEKRKDIFEGFNALDLSLLVQTQKDFYDAFYARNQTTFRTKNIGMVTLVLAE